MRKIKKKTIFKGIFFALTIVTFILLHFYVPRFITEIRNPFIELIRGKHTPNETLKISNKPVNRKYIKFKSFDNLTLSAYINYSNLETTKGTIILLHGIRSNKECFLELSNRLSKLGFNSIALDSRAHGNSQGTHCTFGVNEKYDISKLIDYLEKNENIVENIGIWGQSLGGAIGLQALGNEKRLKFGIIESTFTDFRTITNDYFNYHLGFNSKKLTDYLVERAGKIAQFDIDLAKPIKFCEKINQPIFIVHGNLDKRINIKYARQNFEKILSNEKVFIEIDKANHLNVWKIGGKEYFEKVINFITRNTIGNNV